MANRRQRKIPGSVLLFTPLPWRLSGAGLALALLLRDHPMSAAALGKACRQEGLDARQTARLLARLERRGVLAVKDGVYVCRSKALDRLACPLSERQLLELVGMTQYVANGRMFYTPVPPMSVSSTGAPGTSG